jgi:hypothetical protein
LVTFFRERKLLRRRAHTPASALCEMALSNLCRRPLHSQAYFIQTFKPPCGLRRAPTAPSVAICWRTASAIGRVVCMRI